MSQTSVTTVRMGELAVGRGDDEFKTLLGSCIGLAVFDPVVKVGGLAHVMLPSSSGHDGPVGKFADTAMVELIASLQQLGSSVRNMKAKLAGGAKMFATAADMSIGDKNLEAIQRELKTLSIPVRGRHCGGIQGRRMTFHPATGAVLIEVVGCETVAI